MFCYWDAECLFDHESTFNLCLILLLNISEQIPLYWTTAWWNCSLSWSLWHYDIWHYDRYWNLVGWISKGLFGSQLAIVSISLQILKGNIVLLCAILACLNISDLHTYMYIHTCVDLIIIIIITNKVVQSIRATIFVIINIQCYFGIWIFLHFPEGFAICRTPPFPCLLVCVFTDNVLHWFDRRSQRCDLFQSHLALSTTPTVIFIVTTTYVGNGKIQTFVLLLLSGAEVVCEILPDEISLGKNICPAGSRQESRFCVVVIMPVVIREQVWSLYSTRFCMAVRRCHRLFTWRLCLVTQAEASTGGRCLLANSANNIWTIIANQSTELLFGLVWTALIHVDVLGKRHLESILTQ